MKLKEYLKKLEDLYEKYGDIELYYSIDDEGNDYREVYYNPSFNYLTKEENELVTPEELEEDEEMNALKEVIIIN